MEIVYDIIGDILDALALIFLFDVLMGKNYKVKRGLVFTIFIPVVIGANYIIDLITSPFLLLLAWEMVFFGLAFLYESKLSEKMISSIAFNVMGIAAEMVVVSIFSFLGEKQLINEYFYMELMISKLIVFVLIIIISLIYKKKNCLKSPKYKYIFLVSLLISILELIAIVYIMLRATDAFVPEIGIVAVAVVVINFILYLFVDGYSEMYEHKEREMQLEKSMRIQEDTYSQLSNNYVQMRRIIHDTNKHMKTIAGLIENNNSSEALEYIDDTLGEVNSTYKKVDSGNVVIDVMISNLINQCEVFEIECHTSVLTGARELEIENRDMAILIGNLTENAINYEKSITDKEKKIDMAIIVKGDSLVIDIKNTCYESEAASKKDCGIENIEKIIEKYFGTYTRKVESEYYISTIIIPLNA